MALDTVPWFVEGGAEHSAEVARLVAYLATGGAEGVVTSPSFRVQALATPGEGVRVVAGAAVVRNRALGGDYQSYIARQAVETELDTNPSTSAGPRSDLVILRVENPHISGEPWQQPGDVKIGPYVFLRVIEGVHSTCRSVHELNLGYSAITLARIDFPPSTGTVTAAMITDLRSIVNPTTGVQPPPGPPTDDDECDDPDPNPDPCPGNGDDGDNDDGEPCDHDQTDYFNWPEQAVWNIKIPSWATHVDIRLEIINAQLRHGSLGGYIRILMGGTSLPEGRWRCDWPNATVRQSIVHERADVPIPPSLRGKTVQWRIQTRVHLGFLIGLLLATDSTRAKLTLHFEQKAE